MNKEKKETPKKEEKEVNNSKPEEGKMREIIIHTDGKKIKIVKADIAGPIEFAAILQIILNKLEGRE